jgi:hypothetical protein
MSLRQEKGSDLRDMRVQMLAKRKIERLVREPAKVLAPEVVVEPRVRIQDDPEQMARLRDELQKRRINL